MFKVLNQTPIVLASASPNRAAQLKSLGLEFDIIAADCDESLIKKTYQSNDFKTLALTLAKHKALAPNLLGLNASIIAADQICALEDQYFDKPLTHDNAKRQLQTLSGKTQQIITGLCIAQKGQIIWEHIEITHLTMHTLSDHQVETYLSLERPYFSCGSYHYESLGKWLFKEIIGLESNIIGLALPVLSNALCQHGIVSFLPDFKPR